MRQTRSEIKAKLLADYAPLLEDVLEQGAAAKTLTSIEARALQTGPEVGIQVTKALLENWGSKSYLTQCVQPADKMGDIKSRNSVICERGWRC